MSRIGKQPVTIPDKVSVKIQKNAVTVKGPKGELTETFNPDITMQRRRWRDCYRTPIGLTPPSCASWVDPCIARQYGDGSIRRLP